MKRKNGFTLIELVVVIALIAILAVTLAPRLRDQIAKAKDAKAISVLGSLRTLSEVYYADFEKSVIATTSIGTASAEATAMGLLIPDLDTSSVKLLQEAAGTTEDGSWATADGVAVQIGGSRDATKGTVTYGGKMGFTFDSPDSTVEDGVLLWFSGTSAVDGSGNGSASNTFDVKGLNWSSY